MYLIDYYHFSFVFSCNRGKSIIFVSLIKNYSLWYRYCKKTYNIKSVSLYTLVS